jgi:hypothetical protein
MIPQDPHRQVGKPGPAPRAAARPRGDEARLGSPYLTNSDIAPDWMSATVAAMSASR